MAAAAARARTATEPETVTRDAGPARPSPPSQRLPQSTAQVLQLQRSAGNAAVARALSPPPARTLSRLKLDSGQVLSAVQSIPFMAKKLGESLRGEEMKEQVDRALKKYETLHGAAHRGRTNTGVMLAMALEGVARMIAEELYDPSIQGALAVKLFEAYESEIKAATGLGSGSGGADESLGLAKVLVGDDPLALFMHGELRVEVAAQRIRDMAAGIGAETGKAARTPEKMFHLLRHKWEAQMAAQSRSKIEASEPAKGSAYNIKEATGELSARYMEKLFGPVESAQEKPVGRGLEFTPEAQTKLDQLKAEVITPSPGPGTFTPRTAGMTERQERHLTEIEAREQAAGTGDAKKDLTKAVAASIGIAEDQAAGIVDDIDRWLQSVPLTITVWGSGWFGKGVPTGAGTSFKPATKQQQTKSAAEVFEKPGATGDVHFTGKYTDPKYGAERGDKYLRFRKWKDNLLTGLLDFDLSEMPVFGAANVNWERTRGSTEGVKKDGVEPAAGENYYGDTHFLLRNALRNRVIYTATDHGPPRRNPLFALLDFVKGTTATGLGTGPKPAMLAQVINAAKTKSHDVRADLPFEIQIFGGLDIARDVESIHYSPALPDAIKANIDQFCTANGLGKEEIASIKGKATVVDAGPSATRAMKATLQEQLLGTLATNENTAAMQGHNRELTLQALTLLNFRVMSDADFATLKKGIDDVMSLSSSVEPKVLDRLTKLKQYVDSYDPNVPKPV